VNKTGSSSIEKTAAQNRPDDGSEPFIMTELKPGLPDA